MSSPCRIISVLVRLDPGTLHCIQGKHILPQVWYLDSNPIAGKKICNMLMWQTFERKPNCKQDSKYICSVESERGMIFCHSWSFLPHVSSLKERSSGRGKDEQMGKEWILIVLEIICASLSRGRLGCPAESLSQGSVHRESPNHVRHLRYSHFGTVP